MSALLRHYRIGQLVLSALDPHDFAIAQLHIRSAVNTCSFFCVDCNVDTTDEYYMVKHHLWPLDPQGGMLCIGCLETRLGRELLPADFLGCLLTQTTTSATCSPRLFSRLAATTVLHPSPLAC